MCKYCYLQARLPTGSCADCGLSPVLANRAIAAQPAGNKALARSVLSPIGCEPLRRCPSYLIHLARSGRGCITHTVCLL